MGKSNLGLLEKSSGKIADLAAEDARVAIQTLGKQRIAFSAKDLYNDYVHQARKSGITPKSKRPMSNYINELSELGYLKVERAKVRGNVRSFWIA